MKTNLAKILCGFALLGVAVIAPAQSLVDCPSYQSSSAAFPMHEVSASPAIADAYLDYHGMIPNTDSRGVWGCTNFSSTLNPATAPYLSWTINVNTGYLLPMPISP